MKKKLLQVRLSDLSYYDCFRLRNDISAKKYCLIPSPSDEPGLIVDYCDFRRVCGELSVWDPLFKPNLFVYIV